MSTGIYATLAETRSSYIVNSVNYDAQVIAAGKPFQGNQLAPHMLTAQGKQVLQGQTGKEIANYYLCMLK